MRVQPTHESLTVRGSERPMPSTPGTDSIPADGRVPAKPQRHELDEVVAKMNQAASIFDKALKFKVAEGNRIIVKVINTTTGEVLKEIPPEKLVEAFKDLGKAIGLLVDRKV